ESIKYGGLMHQAQVGSMLALAAAADRATRWIVNNCDPGLAIRDAVAHFRPGLVKLATEFETHLSGAERERFERIYRGLRRDGIEEEVAHELTRIAFADELLDVL